MKSVDKNAPYSDEVDEILSAWKNLIPEADLAPLSVFSRLTRLARHLDVARRAAFSRVNLEPWSFDVLSALRRAGEPYALTPGALMQLSLVSSGTMTNRIDRLEERGLVTRLRHPDDRRAVLVALTDAGQQSADAAITELLAIERTWLGDMPEADVAQLADLLRSLQYSFDNPQ